MLPRSNLQDCVVRPFGAGVLVVAPGHRIHQLDALCGAVLSLADGSRDLAALQVAAAAQVGHAVTSHEVAEALDRLADAGLLTARDTPPAGVSRRGMLQRLTGAAALAALLAVVKPESAAAAEGGVCGEEKALMDEVAYLLAEQEGVAAILEDWVEAGWEEEKTDEFYLAELKISEMERKKKADYYDDQLDDLSGDLAACKFEQTAAGLKKADEQRTKANVRQREKIELQYKKRADEQAKKSQQLKERAAKKKADEQVAKKDQLDKAKSDEQLEQRRAEQEKKRQQMEERLDARVRQEEKLKADQQVQYKERLGGNMAKEAQLKKQQKERLASAEDRNKSWADAYEAKAREEAAKQDGATDQYLMLAQEESFKAMERSRAKEKDYKNQQFASEQKEKDAAYQKAKEQEAKKAEMQSEEAKKQAF